MTRRLARTGIVVTVALMAALCTFVASAEASQPAQVVSISYKVGAPAIDVVVAVPKKTDTAARKRGADYGLCVSVTYIDLNGSIQTIQSGRVSISGTTAVGSNKSDAYDQLTISFGSTATPANTPSWSATAVIVDPGEGCP